MNINDIVQQHVDVIAAEQYADDAGLSPMFVVSVYEQSILLTCMNHGHFFSEQLFPNNNMTYGLSNVEDIMENLYNRTM